MVFVEGGEVSVFDGVDVDEYVFLVVVWLDEIIIFLGVELFYGVYSYGIFFLVS